MEAAIPAVAVCGWSGSGKTTLLAALVEQLVSQGLRVAVIKHDVHGLARDSLGKDTDRLFRAGATVAALGPDQSFQHARVASREKEQALSSLVRHLQATHDLVLVEGFKTYAFARKVWLCRHESERPPETGQPWHLVLEPAASRLERLALLVDAWLKEHWQARPKYAGILIGGRSERMGRPKHLLERAGRSWLECTIDVVRRWVDRVTLLGMAELPASARSLPVLADVPDRQGPLAGILAAQRWCPEAAWVIVACDLPYLTGEAIRWLLGQRAPGRWVVLPRLGQAGPVEPLLAVYEPQARVLLERVEAPSLVVGDAKVAVVEPPQQLWRSWIDVDTPDEVPR